MAFSVFHFFVSFIINTAGGDPLGLNRPAASLLFFLLFINTIRHFKDTVVFKCNSF
jgi:hypothetical protein